MSIDRTEELDYAKQQLAIAEEDLQQAHYAYASATDRHELVALHRTVETKLYFRELARAKVESLSAAFQCQQTDLQQDQWRDVPVEGIEHLYQVSNRGVVFSRRANKTLSPQLAKSKSYIAVNMSRPKDVPGPSQNTYQIHHLMMVAFDMTEDESLKIIKPIISSLVEAKRLKRKRASQQQVGARFSSKVERVREIRRLINEKVPTKEIAERYGVDPSTVRKYGRGTLWGNV